MSTNLKITEDLLQYLEKIYPDQLPSKKIEDRDLWIKVGQVEVVRFLRDLKEEGEEDVLG